MLTPNHFITLLLKAASVGNKLNSLQKFALGDVMSEMLSRWELEAARESLRKAALANDPKFQIWSGIGHLESAHEIFRSIHEKRPKYISTFHVVLKRSAAAHKDVNVLVLMALLYKCVEEDRLCDEMLSQASNLAKFSNRYVENEIRTQWFNLTTQLSVFLFDPRVYYLMHTIPRWEGFNSEYVYKAKEAISRSLG